MNIVHRLACVAVAALLPTAASAQSANFRLAALPGNIQGCIAADPQFTRVHVFTVKDGEAEITAAGGIHLKMKLTRPNVYEGDYALGTLHMHLRRRPCRDATNPQRHREEPRLQVDGQEGIGTSDRRCAR